MTNPRLRPALSKSGPARSRARLAAGLAAASVLAACLGGGMLSGGGSGIENPALILAFKDGKGAPVQASGKLQLYYEGSNWKDSSIYSRSLSGQDTAMITSRDLQALPKAIARLEALPPDSSVGVNVIVSGNGSEGLLTGFRLRGSRNRGYSFARSASAAPESEVKAEFPLAPPVMMFTGSIPSDQMDKGIVVVFIPGSPYFSPVTLLGNMMFPILPQGTFPVKAAAPSPLSDTLLTFYCTTDSLHTDRAFAPGHWEPCAPERAPLIGLP